METEKFNYYLPPDLIAQKPAATRDSARLLVLNRSDGSLKDSTFRQISDFLKPNDCLVLNDTKVLPAKFFAQKPTGAKIQGLFLSEPQPHLWEVMLKNIRGTKSGVFITLLDRAKNPLCRAELFARTEDGNWLLKLDITLPADSILAKIGFAPLPPYIKRTDGTFLTELDTDRYQTIYAATPGAVAAPTAGLHFTNQLIDNLQNTGIRFAYLTLQVGPGTFKPVTADTLEQHKMHWEKYSLDDQNSQIINETIKTAGRIIAVGTTSVRTLETIAKDRNVKSAAGETNLFITPGYNFKIVDCLITNFHLPKSTLLALVASFAGLDNILNAYNYAIHNNYRFYSYGDAMLIL